MTNHIIWKKMTCWHNFFFLYVIIFSEYVMMLQQKKKNQYKNWGTYFLNKSVFSSYVSFNSPSAIVSCKRLWPNSFTCCRLCRYVCCFITHSFTLVGKLDSFTQLVLPSAQRTFNKIHLYD